jgi:Fe-S cluster assembly protein SufB
MSSSIDTLVNREYQYGFVTDVETDTIPPGLSEDVIRLISAKKEEPAWLLDWRLKAYKRLRQRRYHDEEGARRAGHRLLLPGRGSP